MIRLKYGNTNTFFIREGSAKVISCAESRAFLEPLGIAGEIIHTPSHSADSISLILDEGDAFVGDLEPFTYLSAYEENEPLRRDWEHVMAHHPKRIFFAHAGEMNDVRIPDGYEAE